MNGYTLFSAPLQGFTDAVWRNSHAAVYGGVERYYSPFVRVEHGAMRRRDLADVSPERNTACVVPQLLASPPEQAVLMANTLRDMGHTTIDINLGCPHPPVAKKGKGSGMLARPEALRELCQALATVPDARFSVKMRLGWDSPTQWRDALEALAPLNPTHITMHPRIGTQQYGGELLIDEFEALLGASPYPVVYNGELQSLADVEATMLRWPTLAGVMIGRGLAAKPWLATPAADDADHFTTFHSLLVQGYSERLTGGEHQLLKRLQTMWDLMLPDVDRKLRKRIAKAQHMTQYHDAVAEIIAAWRK